MFSFNILVFSFQFLVFSFFFPFAKVPSTTSILSVSHSRSFIRSLDCSILTIFGLFCSVHISIRQLDYVTAVVKPSELWIMFWKRYNVYGICCCCCCFFHFYLPLYYIICPVNSHLLRTFLCALYSAFFFDRNLLLRPQIIKSFAFHSLSAVNRQFSWLFNSIRSMGHICTSRLGCVVYGVWHSFLIT